MIARLTWTEIKLLSREPLTLLVSLGFPILLMVLLASSFGNDPDPDMGGIGGTDFYVPVYAAATVAAMGFLGLPTHLAAYRDSGVLRRFQAAGTPAGVILAAHAAVMITTVVIGSAAMVAIGLAAFDLSAPASIIGVVAGFLLGTVAFAAIGTLLGTTLRTARAAQGVGLLLFFGLFFIAGGGPPPALLPDAVNTAIDFTPMGPLVAAVSDPWHGRGWNTGSLAALAGIAVVAYILAIQRLGRRL